MHAGESVPIPAGSSLSLSQWVPVIRRWTSRGVHALENPDPRARFQNGVVVLKIGNDHRARNEWLELVNPAICHQHKKEMSVPDHV